MLDCLRISRRVQMRDHLLHQRKQSAWLACCSWQSTQPRASHRPYRTESHSPNPLRKRSTPYHLLHARVKLRINSIATLHSSVSIASTISRAIRMPKLDGLLRRRNFLNCPEITTNQEFPEGKCSGATAVLAARCQLWGTRRTLKLSSHAVRTIGASS